jgi:ElaB/YqjD/DUF883 family membrane-anchored ribosome-binding protein
MNTEDLNRAGNEVEKAARPYLKSALEYVKANPKLVALCAACFVVGLVLGKLVG